MTDYLLIYRADPSVMAAMPEPTPEQAAEMISAWTAWAARAGDAIVEFGDLQLDQDLEQADLVGEALGLGR